MGIKEALQEKSRALSALNIYREQSQELNELQMYIATGTQVNKHPEFINRIGLLQESINKNPVKNLIDAGFMPTIVEDVETISQDYSYKGKLFEKLNKKADKAKSLGNLARNITSTLYMTENTGLYQFLRYSTQVSDFTARYALYQHLTKQNKLSEYEILKEITDSFVNYDVPSHRMIEAANSIGLLYFTKYFLRIQAPLFKAMREHPLRAMQLWLFDAYTSGIDIVTGSSFTARSWSPFQDGPFKFLDVVDETITAKAIGSSVSALVPGK
jgi:hypothetical protein